MGRAPRGRLRVRFRLRGAAAGSVVEEAEEVAAFVRRLAVLLGAPRDDDARATLGAERKGRPKAAAIADEVDAAAQR